MPLACDSSGETDLIKKGEGDDVGLLSGTHVMEGSGRMLVVGVGLNSQVGSIMSLLGAADSGKNAKDKKGAAKPAGRAPSTGKVSTDLPKQSARIEDETKPPTAASSDAPADATHWRQVEARKTDAAASNGNTDIKPEAPKPTTQGGTAQLADETEDEEGDEEGGSDAKHKCKSARVALLAAEHPFCLQLFSKRN